VMANRSRQQSSVMQLHTGEERRDGLQDVGNLGGKRNMCPVCARTVDRRPPNTKWIDDIREDYAARDPITLCRAAVKPHGTGPDGEVLFGLVERRDCGH